MACQKVYKQGRDDSIKATVNKIVKFLVEYYSVVLMAHAQNMVLCNAASTCDMLVSTDAL